MGDRANVAVVQPEGEGLVYLYTHWAGTELPFTVQNALKRKQRWNDGAYLTRIIFSEMVKGQESAETGYGISTRMCDNEHQIVVVNPIEQTIGFAEEGEEPKCRVTWDFDKYIGLTEEDIRKEYER
jgi:hypothetical protein